MHSFTGFSALNKRNTQKSVDPIRDVKQINAMKTFLKRQNIMDYILFVIGINVALRISDLLTLTWNDVLNDNKKIFKSIHLVEGKTNKKRDNKHLIY